MTAAVLRLRPRVGRHWPGGVYAGVAGDHHLVAGPLMSEPADWSAAIAWATSVSINGCTDFSLPTRAELLLLESRFPRLFKREVYWTCEPHADSPADAWAIHLGCDLVTHWGKHHPAHAVAVRRESITPSTFERRT